MQNLFKVWLPALLLLIFCSGAALAAPSAAITPSPSPSLPISSNFSVTFSEEMDASTINGTTSFQFTPAAAVVVTCNTPCTTATVVPVAALSYGTPYSLAIGSGVMSKSGAAVTGTTSWAYTTPGLPFQSPRPGGTQIAATTLVQVMFTEQMDAATINGTTFRLSANGTYVTGNVTYDGTTATFQPLQALAYNTPYTVTLTSGIKTVTNQKYLPADVVWTFTTAAAPATVTATSPAANATEVATGTNVMAVFSMSMTASTIVTPASTFTLTSGSGPVSGTVTYDAGSNTATFTPAAPLSMSTTYTASLSSGAKDSLGRSLVPYSWAFTTVIAPVRVSQTGITYGSLQTAYDAFDSVQNGGIMTLSARVYNFEENLDLNRSITVSLQGGCDTGYNPGAGYTTLSGVLTVTSGALTVNNVIVAP